MCGRLDQRLITEAYIALLAKAAGVNWQNLSQAVPQANAAPGQYRPVIRWQDGGLIAEDCFWGYRPGWAEHKLPVAINARLDKLSGAYWKPLLKSGRLIVPASGWYEWTGPKGKRQPWHIYPQDEEPIFLAAIAGIASEQHSPPEAGFAVITDAASGGMVDIHDRQPIVLSKQQAIHWLSSEPSALQLNTSSTNWLREAQAAHSMTEELALEKMQHGPEHE